MTKLVVRKGLLIAVLVPLLHFAGFAYASLIGPHQVSARYNFFALDQTPPPPLVPAYAAHVRGLLAGNLGEIQYVPIRTYIGPAFVNSAGLLACAFGVTVVLGPALGVWAVSRHTHRIRPAAQVLLTVGASAPGFFFGSLLIAAILLVPLPPGWNVAQWIPIQGFGWNAHLIVPVLTLAIRPVLYIANLAAGLLEDELQQDYIRVARSKGIAWRRLVWNHAIPNIRSTMIVALGQSFRLMASTLILVEALFDWRGVGWQFLNVIALSRRGQPSPLFMQPQLLALLVGCFGLVLLFADLVASVAAAWIDPRLRQPSAAVGSA